MRRMIYPQTSEKTEENYETGEEDCSSYMVKANLRIEYCSIGGCIKEELGNTREEEN